MSKRKPVQEIPIKCLSLADPLGMPLVIERLFAATRLIHIHGVPSVGKTAFCFKIVYKLIDKQPDAWVLWIYFDDEIDYWKSAFEALKPRAQVSYLKIDTKSTEHFYRVFGKAIQGNPYKLVIMDGLQYANLDLQGMRYSHLLSFFCVKAEQFRIPIIATHRNPVPRDTKKDPQFLLPVYTHAEHWNLYMPAYFTDPLRKGESYVIMPKDLSWPDASTGKSHYLP